MTDARRALPSVNALLESEAVQPMLARAPRALVVDAVRATIDAARRAPADAPRDEHEWATAIENVLAARERPSLRPVLNATGVVLHTNLGRAPLAAAALDAIRETAGGFSNLEYDLDAGTRGSRYTHCVALVRELTGADDALVVNNGAAALVLALNTLAEGREAIVSRGELIEIGGSFRVPDIMAKSGARLVEVGTTNRTHADDYRSAIGPETGAIVKVHRSNFALAGFVAEADIATLAALAGAHRLPLLYDLGSGLLIPLDEYGLRGEPTAGEALRQGATLVAMSGDKLLGGPQAGLIAGSAAVIERMRRNPLTRALRVDKLTLAALEATLALYRDPRVAVREIPVLAMLAAPVAEIRARAASVCDALAAHGIEASVCEPESTVGGGAFPTARIRSAGITLGGAPDVLERLLRSAEQPIIGRIEDGRFVLDLRSVPPSDDERLVASIRAALT